MSDMFNKMRSTSSLILLLSIISNFGDSHGESFKCVGNNCGKFISCTNMNENCLIDCIGPDSCSNIEILISPSHNSHFNITCHSSQSCTNLNVFSDRQGTIQCNTVKSCSSVNISVNDVSNTNGGSHFICHAENSCYNSLFSCKDNQLCSWWNDYNVTKSIVSSTHTFNCISSNCDIKQQLSVCNFV